MSTLLDVIKYDHKHYSELTNTAEQQEVERLALKLQSIENEIINHEAGSITIMKSGNIFTTSYPIELGDKITKLIAG